jgi:hypothetical protein
VSGLDGPVDHTGQVSLHGVQVWGVLEPGGECGHHLASTQTQLDSQASARPAGRDPRSATSARSAYELANPLKPSDNPAARNNQPIRFSGRREAITNPAAGTATFTTCPETLETVQPVRLAGAAGTPRLSRHSRPSNHCRVRRAVRPDRVDAAFTRL